MRKMGEKGSLFSGSLKVLIRTDAHRRNPLTVDTVVLNARSWTTSVHPQGTSLTSSKYRLALFRTSHSEIVRGSHNDNACTAIYVTSKIPMTICTVCRFSCNFIISENCFITNILNRPELFTFTQYPMNHLVKASSWIFKYYRDVKIVYSFLDFTNSTNNNENIIIQS